MAHVKCPECRGKGWLPQQKRDPAGHTKMGRAPCFECYGTGTRPAKEVRA